MVNSFIWNQTWRHAYNVSVSQVRKHTLAWVNDFKEFSTLHDMLFGGHQFFAKRSTVFHEEQFNRKENSSLVRNHCFPRAFRMINTKKRVKWNQANAVRLTWIISDFITSHNFCTIWIVGLIYYTKSPSLIALSFLVFFFQ